MTNLKILKSDSLRKKICLFHTHYKEFTKLQGIVIVDWTVPFIWLFPHKPTNDVIKLKTTIIWFSCN